MIVQSHLAQALGHHKPRRTRGPNPLSSSGSGKLSATCSTQIRSASGSLLLRTTIAMTAARRIRSYLKIAAGLGDPV